nr:prepilin-type N-terminal cleavage/methylation domain-containing protein [Geotalea daltonii]
MKEVLVLQTISKPDNSGFTLIEVMVSILIMTVGLLGLLQTVILATEHNLRNQMRDEAVEIGEVTMHAMKAKPFAMLTSAEKTTQVSSRRPGFSSTYAVKQIVSNLTGDSKQLIVDIRWKFKNISSFHHQVVSIKSK